MPKRNVATNFTFEQQRQEINLIAADLWDGVLGGSSTDFSTVVGWGDHNQAGYLKADGTVATTAAFTFGNKIIGPSTFTIEPTNVNGTVVIAGNLQVDGTQTAVNSTTMDVTDLNITVAKGAANAAAADTAGITVDGANATLQYEDGSPGTWESSLGFRLDGRNASAGLKLNLAGSADYLIRESTTDDIVQFGGTGGANFFAHNISSGNIGIAEANPSYKLDVNGTLRVTGNSTFGANGSITSGGNFTLNGNGFVVTGTQTAVGEFKGATIPTIQVTQTTDNTDLQLRANATGGLVRTATNKPLILGTNQEQRIIITEDGDVKIGLDSVTTRTDSAHFGFNITGKSGTGAGSIFFNDTADNCDANIAADNGVLMITADYSDNTADSAIKFRVDGSSEKLVIKSDGEIRIDGPTSATHGIRFTPNGWNGYDNRIGICGSSGADSWWSSNWNPTDGSRDSSNYATNYIRHNVSTGYIEIGTGAVDTSPSIRLKINSDGQVNLGNSGINQAQFCQAGNNHYVVGQAADNVAALEVYSQHGSSSSKLSFGVYDNRTGSKSASFLVRGDGSVEDGIGNLRSIPANNQPSAYSLASSDAGKCVLAGGQISIPSDVGFVEGDAVTIINNSASAINFAHNSVTLYNTADGTTLTSPNATLGARGMCTIYFVSNTVAYISGSQIS